MDTSDERTGKNYEVVPDPSDYVGSVIAKEADEYDKAFEEFRNERAKKVAPKRLNISLRERQLLEVLVEILTPAFTQYSSRVSPKQWEIQEEVARRQLRREIERFTDILSA